MKVFEIITRSDLGGAQSVMVGLVNNLVARPGNSVHVISSPDGEMWKNLSPQVIQHKISALKREISVNDFKVAIELFRLYKIHKPDIIHLHSSKIGAIGRLIFPKAKIIYTVHGFLSVQMANKKFLVLERLLAGRAESIICVSYFDKIAMHQEGIRGNISVIYNGVSIIKDPLDNDGRKLLDKMREKKNDGYQIVLCIARLSPQKKFHLFIETAARMLDEKIIFLWIGNTVKPDTVLPPNVIMGGEINNASAFNEIADLFMLPSNYEGLPMSIIEAQSWGVPAVASNVGGVNEILDGSNGAAIQNDPEEFVRWIRYFLVPENHDTACRKAFEKFDRYFRLEKMCSNYQNLFERIVQQNKKQDNV